MKKLVGLLKKEEEKEKVQAAPAETVEKEAPKEEATVVESAGGHDDGHAKEGKDTEDESSGGLMFVGKALMEGSANLKGWGPGDITLGLYYLKKDTVKEREMHPLCIDSLDGICKEKEKLEELAYWTDVIEGTYKADEDELCAAAGIPRENLILADFKSTVVKPGHYLALIPERKKVVFAVRGTKTVADALTDATMAVDEFQGGYIHRGIHEAAKWMVANRKGDIMKALEENPGFELVLVGHSLGGGVAGVLAIMFAEMGIEARAFVIGSAAAISKDLAEGCKGRVTTVVHRDDIIPRLSVLAVDTLQNRLLDFPWKEYAKEDMGLKRVAEQTQATKEMISKAAASVTAHKTVANILNLGASNKDKEGSIAAKAENSEAMKKAKEEFIDKEEKPAQQEETQEGGEAKEEGTPVAPESESKEGVKEEVGFDGGMYPPGTCYHLFDIDGVYHLREVPNDFFTTIELSDTMVPDHSTNCYIDALKGIIDSL